MSAFGNRFVLILLGLVLTAFALLVGLVDTGVIAARDVLDVVDYRTGLDDLVAWSDGDGITTLARIIGAVASVVIALIALWWLARELSFGYRRPSEQTIPDADTMSHTDVAPSAVRHLVEGCALEAGALSAKASVRPGRSGHVVRCSIVGDAGTDLYALPTVVRDRVQQHMTDNQLIHDSVTVTVDGVARRKRVVR